MSASVGNAVLTCEQCGAPLRNSSEGAACLYCLLSSGIEQDNETPEPYANRKSGQRYQHYEIILRADGSPWELRRDPTGTTYKARDINLGITIALKVIDPRLSNKGEVRQRFLTEARAAAQFLHPNVARVLHFGTVQNDSAKLSEEAVGECFYGREFVEGESLEERVRRSGRLSLDSALEIARLAAKAIVSAQRRGLSHGQLEPANLILLVSHESDATGRENRPWVKIIEFGLGRLNGEDTRIAADEKGREFRLGKSSDIYSLGKCVWFALTGEIFVGDLPRATCLSRLNEDGVPTRIARILAGILMQDEPRFEVSGIDLIKAIEEFQSDRRQTCFFNRRRALAIAAVLTLLVVGLGIYFARRPSDTSQKSIAVLPFRNLSRDPANAFFAEGVQDDIVSRLIKIRDLKVVSRLGAAQYPADKPRDLHSIGEALGVRHLLEGSLRREADRVRLHVSLIDSRNNREIWSEGYDRTLADAINLQGELAADIADALNATLNHHEKQDVRADSTHNADAYVLYLQGRGLESNPAFAISAYEGAEALYRHAVGLDPRFASAHARLSITSGLLYRFRGSTEELRTSARLEAEKALELNPRMGEAHLALGLYYYRVERDYSRALPELEAAQELTPNDTEAEMTIAFVHRRQGQWRVARREQEAVRLRDPVFHEFERELDATACLLRDWQSASEHSARAVMLAPKVGLLRGEQALVSFWAKGDLGPLQKHFASLKGYGDPEGMAAWTRWDTAMLARDFAGAQAGLEEFPMQTLPSIWGAPVPKSYLKGCTSLAQGDTIKAHEMFEIARPTMEAEVVAHPADPLRRGRLGLLYAYLDRKANAVREAKKATQLTPVTDDAIDGHQCLCNLALVYSRVGDTAHAIPLIQKLLSEPGCVSPLNEASLSLWDLRMRWQWDPLRKDARFQQILAGPEPATIY